MLVNPIASRQVFTIRRIIGENTLDRNESLWREVDALEDILGEANASAVGEQANVSYEHERAWYRSERFDALTDLAALNEHCCPLHTAAVHRRLRSNRLTVPRDRLFTLALYARRLRFDLLTKVLDRLPTLLPFQHYYQVLLL